MARKQGEQRFINERAFDYYVRLKRVRDFVAENYSDTVTFSEAARVAAMERTYFSTFFREKVGITFSEWLRIFRVLRAIEIMKTSDQTICDIAFAVGFGDLRTFERAFKHYTSQTPSEYRKSVRPA